MHLRTLKIQSYSGMKPYLLIDFHLPSDFHKPPGRVLFFLIPYSFPFNGAAVTLDLIFNSGCHDSPKPTIKL